MRGEGGIENLDTGLQTTGSSEPTYCGLRRLKRSLDGFGDLSRLRPSFPKGDSRWPCCSLPPTVQCLAGILDRSESVGFGGQG